MDQLFPVGLTFAAIIGLVALGIPIGPSLFVGATALLVGGGHSVTAIAIQFADTFHHFTLIAIPLFILGADLLTTGRLTELIFAATNSVVAKVPGGFGISTVLAAMIFGGLTGSSAGDAAAIGKIATDGMTRYGYPRGWAAALAATGANLAILIPPSIAMIIYGAITGTSIGALFTSGVLPGITLGLVLMAYTALMAKRHEWGVVEQVGGQEVLRRWLRVLPVLALPAFVLFGFYTGLFTPTEIAAVCVVGALVLIVLMRRVPPWQDLLRATVGAASASANLFLIIGAGLVLSAVLVQYGVVEALSRVVVSLDLGAVEFLLMLSVVLFVMGMFMDGVALNVLSTPIVFPLLGPLGIDPVHYGVVLVFNVELALITPPVGINLFVMSTATGTPLAPIYRAILPFIVLLVAALVTIILFPGTSLFLPRLFGLV